MVNLQQLQFLAQLVDNIEKSTVILEKAYKDNDGEDFQKSKKYILEIQGKIAEVLR